MLLLALSAIVCVSLASCDFALVPPTASSSEKNDSESYIDESTDTQSASTDTESDGGNDSQVKPDDSSTNASSSNGGSSETKPDGSSSSSSSTSESKPNSSSSSGSSSESKPNSSSGASSGAEKPNDEVVVPAGKLLVNVQVFTVMGLDGGNLIVPCLVDETAKFEDLFNEYVDDIISALNATGESWTSEASQETAMRNAFWQCGSQLLESGDALKPFSNNGKMNVIITPSGAGGNVSLYIDSMDGMPNTIPFPIGVALDEFINWAHSKDIFPMTYEQSLTQGYWKNEWNETVGKEWETGIYSNILFVYGSPEQGTQEPFTGYVRVVYGYSQSEEGVYYTDGYLKELQYTVDATVTEISLSEALMYAGGVDYSFTYVYYIDGEQVWDTRVLEEDCVVVCVVDTEVKEFNPFTITVSVDGKTPATYTYTNPVTRMDAVLKYCKANGLDYSDYTWLGEEASISADVLIPVVHSVTVNGSIYAPPVAPVTSNVTITKYDGANETKKTYTTAYGKNFDDFVKESVYPEYDKDNIANNEYAFYLFGDSLNEFSCAILEGTYDVLMIKRSALTSGYTVDCDLLTAEGITEQVTRTMNIPATLRHLIWELTDWELDPTGYQFTINGKVIEGIDGGDKVFNAYEYDLYYKNVTLKVRPIFKVNAVVETKDESAKSKTITYYEMPTLAKIAQDLALSRSVDSYLWLRSSDSQDYIQGDMPFGHGYSEYTVYIKARKVYVDLYFVTADGMDFYLETSMDAMNENYGWEWSVSARNAVTELLGGGTPIATFDEFTWTAKGMDGEFAVTDTTVLEYTIVQGEMPSEWGYGRTVYSLMGTRKAAEVDIVEQDGNGNETHRGKAGYALSSTITVGRILQNYGYTKDNYAWLEFRNLDGSLHDEFNSWDWDSVITRPVQIVVHLN